MGYRILADVVMVTHLGFVVFALLGGLLVLRYRRLIWAHAPTVAWAVLIELAGWVCPLTPLENWLRRTGDLPGYESSFTDRYIVPILYPEELTRPIQIVLGMLVLALNAAIYTWIFSRQRAGGNPKQGRPVTGAD